MAARLLGDAPMSNANGKPGGKNVTPASCNAKPPDAV